jgi:hypothetical protein
MPEYKSKTPTADELKTWLTSRLFSCFLQVEMSSASGPRTSPHMATLRKLYAAEIDRRFPVGAGR